MVILTSSRVDSRLLRAAYALLDVKRVESHRLLKVRNPHARNEWEGEWGDRDLARDPAKARFRKALGFNEDEDDGVFWIAWEDYLRHFDGSQITTNPSAEAWEFCETIDSEWVFRGDNADSELSCFELTIKRPCQVVLTVANVERLQLGFCIVQKDKIAGKPSAWGEWTRQALYSCHAPRPRGSDAADAEQTLLIDRLPMAGGASTTYTIVCHGERAATRSSATRRDALTRTHKPFWLRVLSDAASTRLGTVDVPVQTV